MRGQVPLLRERLIEPEHLLLGTVDVTILCGEQPRMKKRLAEMQHNIAEGLGIDSSQVHVKVSSMDGQDEIARQEGIEARVLISLWEGI
jgi:2C-methyl-D-erythritol 2,4-cyclodiphosphate synthase